MNQLMRRSSLSLLGLAAALLISIPSTIAAQQSGPVVVQPGAPGKPTKVLPASTTAKLPPASPKDVEFMQGMIIHHAQAVVMTALIKDRTKNPFVRRIGARISHSQSEEIKFMKRWLVSRGEPIEPKMGSMHMKGENKKGDKMDMSGMKMDGDHAMMPGMLTPNQMKALAAAKGEEFDRLFLTGMIQHHIGALVMVKDLYEAPGAGQDAELFNFATDVDSGQRAEIRIMRNILGELPKDDQ